MQFVPSLFVLKYENRMPSYHLADKKIPSIHGYTTGLKLEQFIFDVFNYSPSTALFEVRLDSVLPKLKLSWGLRTCWHLTLQVVREEEFAPVKNANGAAYDTPDSARLMLLRLHSRWVVTAGGFLTHSVPLYMTGNFLYGFVSANFWEPSTAEDFSDRNSTSVMIIYFVFIGVEVSPLSSYSGENLEAICRGRTFHAPSEISF